MVWNRYGTFTPTGAGGTRGMAPPVLCGAGSYGPSSFVKRGRHAERQVRGQGASQIVKRPGRDALQPLSRSYLPLENPENGLPSDFPERK